MKWTGENRGRSHAGAILVALLGIFPAAAHAQSASPAGDRSPTEGTPMSGPSTLGAPVPPVPAAASIDEVNRLRGELDTLSKELEKLKSGVGSSDGDSSLNSRVKMLEDQQRGDTGAVTQLRSTTDFLAGVTAMLGLLGGYVLFRQHKRLKDAGIEGLVDSVSERLSAGYQERLSSLWSKQLDEVRRNVLARDRSVYLMGENTESGRQAAALVKRRLEAVGFDNFASSLDDAAMVMVIGQERCIGEAEALAQRFKGKIVPVIFNYGAGRMDPDPCSKFEFAVIANSHATAVQHLSNLALMTGQQSG